MVFLDLPLEILPEIFSHIVKTQHLASLCLVNNSFRTFAVCKLYERVSIYYTRDKRGETKAIKLFDTLSHSLYLARFVYRLEIRDFPKGLDDNHLRHVLNGLKNCVNLRSCAWTRDGSLNSKILEALQQCKNLRELDLNGHNIGSYDPQLLLGFTELHRLSFIKLSLPVVCQFKPWLSATGATLRSLTLICKSSGILTDELLEEIAPSLVNLEHLNLSGCYKVTHKGVWAIVSSNAKGILGLAHEGVNLTFDMAAFADLCISSGALRRLRSFTMTTQVPMYLNDPDWVKHVVHLLSDSPLEIFQICSSGLAKNTLIADELWTQLLLTHGERLLRITVHHALLSWQAMISICFKCTKLKQFFFNVPRDYFDSLGPCLSLLTALRTLHINYPMGPGSPFLPQTQILSILNECSPTITQFGCNTRVWQVSSLSRTREMQLAADGLYSVRVSRTIEVDEDGSMVADRTLGPYAIFHIPEQFLDVRT